MTDDSFSHDASTIYQEALQVLLSKHQDYGPGNIAGAPGGPLNGIRVRLYDKTARINHLLDSGNTPKHESLRDSFLDAANYCLIALMVIDGLWPTKGSWHRLATAEELREAMDKMPITPVAPHDDQVIHMRAGRFTPAGPAGIQSNHEGQVNR